MKTYFQFLLYSSFLILLFSCNPYKRILRKHHVPDKHIEDAKFFLDTVKKTETEGILRVEYAYQNHVYIESVNSRLGSSGVFLSYLKKEDIVKFFGKPMRVTFLDNKNYVCSYFVLNDLCTEIHYKILGRTCGSLTITYNQNNKILEAYFSSRTFL